MSAQTLILLFTLISGFFILYLLLKTKLDQLLNKPADPTLTSWLQSMQGSLSSHNQNLNSTLQRSYNELNQRLHNATLIISDLKKEAGSFSEIGRSMKDLQDLLKSPKLRGNLGEQILKDLISQMFPKNSFFLQYKFKSGTTVDAAIKTASGILPIDSKFPLENFQRLINAPDPSVKKAFIKDVQKHIKDIGVKYILPQENTTDFALMYLPSESIYYEVVNQPDLLEFARQHRVYPVSPTTLYAHLQTILLSFEGNKLQLHSKKVLSLFRSIQHDYQKLNESLNLLNRHLTNAYNQLSSTSQIANQLGQKINMKDLLLGEKDSPLEESS